MSEEAFSKVHGRGSGSYKVAVPHPVDMKSIRKGLNMTQAAFPAECFGFSLDTMKRWEVRRRTFEVPARACQGVS